mgnify:CR=1 FL=1|tara:strand:- start:483 stop:683 length:201 start_codon:yes stop_codon:yes gene_type:complete
MAGAAVQDVAKAQWVVTLHKLGVEMIPYASVDEANRDSVYFSHFVTGEPRLLNQTKHWCSPRDMIP